MGSIKEYDWNAIFDALSQNVALQNIGLEASLQEEPIRRDGIDWETVKSYSSYEENDTSYQDGSFAAIGQLADGQWFTIHAGCLGDYARQSLHPTRTQAVVMGLTNESRKWLGEELPEWMTF